MPSDSRALCKILAVVIVAVTAVEVAHARPLRLFFSHVGRERGAGRL